ncbi:guanylate kinase [Bartonella sp. DGB2]|uniref:guanylate kinase n=1 Tax=Bartonella sp. DGB2 TaxID=3388426 RepID=UPI00398FAC2C
MNTDTCSAGTRRRGVLLVISSPSGAGKSTLCARLMQECAVRLSISATTRPPRGKEKNGVHYHFFSEAEFLQKRDQGTFIEWAEVHGHYYGTLRQTVEDALNTGQDLLFDIDYQGAAQLYEKMPQDIVSVFILPPSMHELRLRLKRRAENSSASMALRLRNAHEEMRHWGAYDYVIINQDIDASFSQLHSIYQAEILKRWRRPSLSTFMEQLFSETL